MHYSLKYKYSLLRNPSPIQINCDNLDDVVTSEKRISTKSIHCKAIFISSITIFAVIMGFLLFTSASFCFKVEQF